jgi:hypothetical protein
MRGYPPLTTRVTLLVDYTVIDHHHLFIATLQCIALIYHHFTLLFLQTLI